MGNTDNLLENFDARVNISRSMAPPFLVGRASAAIFEKKLHHDYNCRACEIKCTTFTEKKYWSSKKLKDIPLVFYHLIARASCKVK
jgi:hypothetical protein